MENHDETSRTTVQPSAGNMIVLNSSHYEEHLVYIEIKTTILLVTLFVILWNVSISILLLNSRTDVISRRFSSNPRLNFMTKGKKKKKVKLSADICDISCYFHASSWEIRWLHRTIYWIIEDPIIASPWRQDLAKSECSLTGELYMLYGLVGAAHLSIACNCKTKVFHHNAQL